MKQNPRSEGQVAHYSMRIRQVRHVACKRSMATCRKFRFENKDS